MGKKFLFINNSDLADTDSNGRTLRDVFSFVDNSDLFSFCTVRKNSNLEKNNVFFANESLLFHPFKMKKNVHVSPKTTIVGDSAFDAKKKRTKKNPLTCIMRNIAWRFTFFWLKAKYKKWVLSIKPDYIVFDPSDFIFMHFLAQYTSKILAKPLILYNTEDYYFKSWNYLHKENGFNWLYPFFRKTLRHAYKNTIKKSKLCLHNVEGLRELFLNEFPSIKHYTVYHPSSIMISRDTFDSSKYYDFYYCGGLDKGRDKTMVLFAKALKEKYPESKIIFNGRLMRNFDEDTVKRLGNIVNLGFCSYSEVEERIKSTFILISVASFDEYNAKDKYHVFSTKLSDYISSLNPIVHIGPKGDEYNILNDNNLAFVCEKQEDISNVLDTLFNYLKSGHNDKFNSQRTFYDKYLNPINTAKQIDDILLENF